MKEKYTLEGLAETFSEHAIHSEKERKKFLEEFQRDYPEEEVPAHMKDDFSIAAALHVICCEILRLKS